MATAEVVAANTGAGPCVGVYSALAEGAWMGAAQAVDVPELARTGAGLRAKRVPRIGLSGLLTREYTVAQATAILMASFFASAVLGAIRQILFNAQFGAGTTASAYYAAFRLPDTLFSLIAGGALSSAMIPVLVSVTRDEGVAGVRRLTNLVLSTLLAAFAVVVILGELFAGPFVDYVLAPGFGPHAQALTVELTRIMLLQPLVLAVGSVATALLNSRNQFMLTALSVASHNIGLIGGILATRADPGLGILGPTYGVVAGAILQVIILAPGILERDFRYRPAWHLSDDKLRDVIRLLIPNGLAVGVLYAGFIVDTAFASKAPQSAALPALHNAWLLAGLPTALFGQAVGQSVFPRLAAYAASSDWKAMRRSIVTSVAAVVVLAVPAAIGLVAIGRPAIRVLFQHGEYGPAASLLTYHVLTPYVLALPAYVATEVLTRSLIALRDTRTPLFTNTVQLIGRAVLMAVLLGSIGVLAIPTAFAVMAAVEALLLAVALALRLRGKLVITLEPVAT